MWPLLAAVAAASVGAWYAMRPRAARTASAEWVAARIDAFADGSGADGDWEDFVGTAFADPFLEATRRRCSTIAAEFPAASPGRGCNEQGAELLRRLALRVRDYGRRRGAAAGPAAA